MKDRSQGPDDRPPDLASAPSEAQSLIATQTLLALAREGDLRARDQIFARYLPRMLRWASGRLPMHARSLMDTNDLVQESLMRVFQRLGSIRLENPGSFQSYVRNAILNRLRDEVRWATRRPGSDGVLETIPDRMPSPLENAIGTEAVERFERGLACLTEEDRELIHLRIELDFTYQEIAAMVGRPSPDAARMGVKRALARLADAMGHEP